MKQAIKATRMVTIGLFTLCTMGVSQAAFATAKTGDPIELKFIGKIKNYPVFQLNLNNNEPEVYFIRIKDENYDELYAEKVKAKEANFSRKYGLDIAQADLNNPGFAVTVEVTSTKTHITQVYKISSHTTNKAENIVVARL